MNLIILIVSSVAFALVSSSRYESLWLDFKKTYKRTYQNEDEENYRLRIFKENLARIEQHNALYQRGLSSYEMGVTKFADMTTEEFLRYVSRQPVSSMNTGKSLGVFSAPTDLKLPDEIDYRKMKNVVNPVVKDQGNCSSCYAFSTIGSLESIYALSTGNFVSLSEQNIVDCTWTYGNLGCSGGLQEPSYNYIMENGIQTESAYPYSGQDGSCKFVPSESVLKVKGHVDIEEGSEKALQAAVATVGPIAVTVDCAGWDSYKGGIFENDQAEGLNHGVVAVGYGADEDGREFWIVRNSFGPLWGEDGYIRIARNKNNQLGIANMSLYPVV